MRSAMVFALVALTAVPGLAQAPVAATPAAVAAPAFEVATIKPSDPAKCCDRTFSREDRRFSTNNTNLKWLIQYAYALQANQIVGGPDWFDRDRYDIAGEIDGQYTPTPQQWLLAVQALLADRFQLKFHHETRELPAYLLTVLKGGPKFEKGDGNPQHSSSNFGGSPGQTMNAVGTNATLARFFGQLQRLALDRPIVDRTGLTGTYNLKLAFTREAPDSVGRTDLPDNAMPNIFDALQQQLGLRLEPVKSAPVDVLVIDSAQSPTAN